MTIDDLEEDDIEVLEEKVTEQLKAKLPFIQIEICPEDFKEVSITHPVGVILLRYLASNYSKPNDGKQLVSYQIETILILRSTVGNKGAYRIMRAIRKALTKFKVENVCGRFYQQHQQLIEKDQSLWMYGQEFSAEGFYYVNN